MFSRIAESNWTCDCCGMTNDQRGCVKGEPTCDCYHFVLPGETFSHSPNFCVTCGRCQLHCPGSKFYEPPRTDRISRYLYTSGSPITKETKEHPFRALGFCHCQTVNASDLVKVREEVEPFMYDLNPGHVNKEIHTICGKWYLPVDEASDSHAPRGEAQGVENP